jgi:hypothetical protein
MIHREHQLPSDGEVMTAIPECRDGRSTPLPAALTKPGSEVTVVTATAAQSQLTESLRHSCNADGTPKTKMPSKEPGAVVEAIPIEVVHTTFDYESLPTEIAGNLRSCAARIRKQVTDIAHSIIVIGHFLIEAKQVLAYGQFIRWVRAEGGFSVSSAENYMRVCEFTAPDDRFATVTILPPAALYLISAKNAPPEVVEAVLARAADGEPVSAAEVKRMVREFKNRNCQGSQGNGELSSCEREQSKNELVRANARAIVKRFGRDGAVFLLEMQNNILETLSLLGREIGVSDGTHPGGTS